MAKRIESGDGQNITCAHTWPVCTISTDNLLRKPYLKQLPFLKPKSTFIQVFIQVMCTGAGGQGSPVVECLFSMKQALNTRPRNRFRILTKYPNWAPRTRAWDPDASLSPDSTLFERHICRIRQAVLTVVPGRQGRQNRSGMSLKRWQETATQVQGRWLESRVGRELQKVWGRWNDSGSEWFQGRGQGGLISVFSGPREKCTSKENLCISMFNQWAVQKSQKFTYSLHTSESVYGACGVHTFERRWKNRKGGRSWGQNSLIGAKGVTVGIRGLDLILDTSGYLPGGFRWPCLTLNKWMKFHNEQNGSRCSHVLKPYSLSMENLFVFQ